MGKFAPVPVQKSETGETSKEQAHKIAEQMIPLEEKISQAAKERKWSGIHTNLTSVSTEGIQEEPGESSKKLAKIAGTGGLGSLRPKAPK